LDGSETDAGEADPGLVAGAAGAERELRRHGDCGEVADLALELEVGAPAAGRWNRHADLHEDLVGLERGRERAGEERCDGDPALARRACGDDLAPSASIVAGWSLAGSPWWGWPPRVARVRTGGPAVTAPPRAETSW